MQIFGNLFGKQAVNLNRALARTTERGNILTQNLANVNTPGYKRRDVDFAVHLEGKSLEPGQRIKNLQNKLATSSISTDQSSVRVDGNSVDLEFEVLSVAETEMRYQLLTDMTSRHFSGLKSAIREGR